MLPRIGLTYIEAHRERYAERHLHTQLRLVIIWTFCPRPIAIDPVALACCLLHICPFAICLLTLPNALLFPTFLCLWPSPCVSCPLLVALLPFAHCLLPVPIRTGYLFLFLWEMLLPHKAYCFRLLHGGPYTNKAKP